jgi:hypothetical protein
MKNETDNHMEKNKNLITKIETYTFDFKKSYHENSSHESFKTYINKFNTMN